MKLRLGIDLDETLINNVVKLDGSKSKWSIKKGALKWLPELTNNFEFHLITARADKSEVDAIVAVIQWKCRVEFESVTLTYYEKKGKFAHDVGCKWLIDDYPEYLSNCKDYDIVPILLNKKKYKKKYKDFVVCENWEEIVKYLQKEYKDTMRDMSRVLKERQDEIKPIEKSVLEIKEIMHGIDQLTNEQQKELDTIH